MGWTKWILSVFTAGLPACAHFNLSNNKGGPQEWEAFQRRNEFFIEYLNWVASGAIFIHGGWVGGGGGGAVSTEGILPDGQLCNKYGGVCVVRRVSPAATHCCRLSGYLSARGGSGLDSTFSNFTLHLVLGDWQLSTVSAEIIHMEVSNLVKKKSHKSIHNQRYER